MANASVICTDKTGTLTQNEMSVVAGSIGIHAKFIHRLGVNTTRACDKERSGPNSRDFAIDMSKLNAVELFNASICVNSTAFEDVDPETGAAVFIGSKTETSVLRQGVSVQSPLRGGPCEAASCQMAEMGEWVRTCGGLGAGHGSPKRDPYPYPYLWVPAPVTRTGCQTRADPY